ncbi:hypothetical protein IW262DRAFT_1295706 [Armillaria fumosa]|nr:hypothetical protein IW262DRAFT_1295706 [Armillaria fumosa]
MNTGDLVAFDKGGGAYPLIIEIEGTIIPSIQTTHMLYWIIVLSAYKKAALLAQRSGGELGEILQFGGTLDLDSYKLWFCASLPVPLTMTILNADTPSVVFFEGEPRGEIHSMTLSACISALMAASETDRVNVIRLEHIKYTTNWQHEAILVELQEVDPDVAVPVPRKAYALIDRDADRHPAKKTSFSSSPSLSSKARDSVKLSRDEEAFTTSSDQYEVRRYIEFAKHPLPFIRLLVAASTVTETKPQYHLVTAQCYWYAESVWDMVVLHLQKAWDGWEKAADGSLAVPARSLAQEMFAKFEGAWTKLEAKIKKQRQIKDRVAYTEGITKGREEAAQEKADLMRKNAALEARLELLEAQEEK